MKVFVGHPILFVVILIGCSNQNNVYALKDMEQMKREVMAPNTNVMGDGKTINDVAATSFGLGNLMQQPFGRFPNYAGLGLQGSGFMFNPSGFGGATPIAGGVPTVSTGFGGTGLPAGSVPYGMNYEIYPGASGNLMFGGGYPTSIPSYPTTAQGSAGPYTMNQLQGLSLAQAQLSQQQQQQQQLQQQLQPQQSQFLSSQLQQIPAYPGFYPQLSPGFRGYQYSIGTI